MPWEFIDFSGPQLSSPSDGRSTALIREQCGRGRDAVSVPVVISDGRPVRCQCGTPRARYQNPVTVGMTFVRAGLSPPCLQGMMDLFADSSHRGRRRQWHPTPVLVPGKSHGWRSLVGCSPWGRWTRLSDFIFTFHFHALKKEMAIHSSVLAWRIPGSGEPGGLPSMGSHRVGHY